VFAESIGSRGHGNEANPFEAQSDSGQTSAGSGCLYSHVGKRNRTTLAVRTVTAALEHCGERQEANCEAPTLKKHTKPVGASPSSGGTESAGSARSRPFLGDLRPPLQVPENQQLGQNDGLLHALCRRQSVIIVRHSFPLPPDSWSQAGRKSKASDSDVPRDSAELESGLAGHRSPAKSPRD
jgi:hypothetical protein